jgi:hypothetical protein
MEGYAEDAPRSAARCWTALGRVGCSKNGARLGNAAAQMTAGTRAGMRSAWRALKGRAESHWRSSGTYWLAGWIDASQGRAASGKLAGVLTAVASGRVCWAAAAEGREEGRAYCHDLAGCFSGRVAGGLVLASEWRREENDVIKHGIVLRHCPKTEVALENRRENGLNAIRKICNNFSGFLRYP